MAKRPTPKSAGSGGKDFSPTMRIVLLAGAEPYYKSEYTARLRAALFEAHGEFETIQHDGLTADAATVLDDCRSYSLMQQHRLVILDSAEALVKDTTRPLFERYAASPSESATLLLRADRWHPGKLDAAIEAVGAVVKCEEPKPHEARAWAIRATPSRHDATLDPDAADALIERIGPDLARLDMELEKLATAAGRGGAITRPLVESLVDGAPELNAFHVKGTLMEGEPARAVRQVLATLEGGPRDLAIPLVWAGMDAARQLHAAAAGLQRGMNPFAIAKAAGLWPDDYREKVLRRARDVGQPAARALLAAAVDADQRQKSGFTDGERVATMLAVRFGVT